MTSIDLLSLDLTEEIPVHNNTTNLTYHQPREKIDNANLCLVCTYMHFFFFLVQSSLIPFLLLPWIHHNYQSHYNLDVSISLGLLLLSFFLFSFHSFSLFFLSLQLFVLIYQFVYLFHKPFLCPLL